MIKSTEVSSFLLKLKLTPRAAESEMHAELRALASQNKVYRSYIGMGYYGTLMPAAIQRSIFENPGWWVGLVFLFVCTTLPKTCCNLFDPARAVDLS